MSKSHIAKKVSADCLRNNWGKAIAVLMVVCASFIFVILTEQLARMLLNIPASVLDMQSEKLGKMVPNTSLGSLIITAASSVLFILITYPFFLGQLSWHYRNIMGTENGISPVLFSFSSAKEYFKTIWFFININLRRLLWAAVFFLPYFAVYFVDKFFIEKGDFIYKDAVQLSVNLLSIIVFSLSLLLYLIFNMRYFLAAYLLVSDPSLSVGKTIRHSTKLMKGYKAEAFWFVMSFLGWFLLCIFIIPVIYVYPFFANARAHYMRNLVQSGSIPELLSDKIEFTKEFVYQ